MEVPNEINAHRLGVGNDDATRRARALLPPHAQQKKPNQLHVRVRSVSELRRLIQAAFRLNSDTNDRTFLKDRQAAAFTYLRKLNELTEQIERMEKDRERHRDRDGVLFRIGQVVQHKEERCRGVVGEWSRGGNNNKDKSTVTSSAAQQHVPQRSSLTLKDYSKAFEESGILTTKQQQHEEVISCNVILDAGDAYAMGSSSGWLKAPQEEWEPVTDQDLMRIRSKFLTDRFPRFDATSQLFVPSKFYEYTFPSDQPNASQLPVLSAEVESLCDDIMEGAKSIAARLDRCILDETSCAAERGLEMVAKLQNGLQRILQGNVMSRKDDLFPPDHVSKLTLAANHLLELHILQTENGHNNLKRNAALEANDRMQFQVGDVVYHTHFGFRGVVTGWDSKPIFDVRRWDGLQHIDDPMNHPFYHIQPDENDCIKAFGGPRGSRYVCQANLEHCSPDRLESIHVHLDPEWEKVSSGQFRPPQSVLYRHGGDLEDEGITERVLSRIQEEFNSWHLNARNPNSESSVDQNLTLEMIFSLLQNVDNQTDAGGLQELIKEMRKAHPSKDLRRRLADGYAILVAGQTEKALTAFQEVLMIDNQYSEAWNILATAQFMFGDEEGSMESALKALELDPKHTNALNGLGLVHFEKEEYEEASAAFRRSMSIDPWSPVSTRLSLTLDLQNRIIFRETAGEDSK